MSLPILVLEHDPVARAMLTGALEALGHCPLGLPTFELALGALDALMFDVMVIDLASCTPDCMTIAARVKGRQPRLKVAAIGAAPHDAFSSLIDAFIEPPYSPASLADVIGRLGNSP